MLLTRLTVAVALVLTITTLAGETRPHTPSELGEAGLVTQPEALRAGERTVLTFTFVDGSGVPLQDLMTHHGRKLHVVIISEDMEVIGHVHPYDFGEPIKGGRARIFFTFPRPGRYLVAADYMTPEGTHAHQFALEVAGPRDAAASEADAAARPSQTVVRLEEDDRHVHPILLDGNSQSDGYSISLQRPDRIEAGEPVTFIYRFSKDGAPLADLRPYLEAPLHVAVIRSDFGHFLHEHGRLPEETHAGHGEASGHNGRGVQDRGHAADHHASHGYQGPATFGPEILTRFTFPEPGNYHLFSQTAHGDRLLISRVPVVVH